jgi:predicted ATPase
MMPNPKYVFTGPPCSGKSSVFEKMKERYHAYHFIPEVARNAIKFFSDFESHKLPWVNREFFQNYVETIQLKNLVDIGFKTDPASPFIYDRGLVDEIPYREFFGMSQSKEIIELCKKHRYDKIFYFPVWEEIYIKDEERIEELHEAKLLDALFRKVYDSFNYELIEMPKVSIEERIEFVLNHINNDRKSN